MTIYIDALKRDKRPQSSAIVHALIDRLEAAEKERDDVAQQLVQSERGKRAISEECDALRNEIAYVKEVEFPRKAQAVADAWKGKCKRLEVERDILRAKIAEMEKQEPVAWQTRTRPAWNDGTWGPWRKCSKEYAEDIKKTPSLHDWLYEARALYALPGAQPAWSSQAVLDITAERRRQIEVECWTPEHDDEHRAGEMAKAAACYALVSAGFNPDAAGSMWPWRRRWWKPSDKRRDLIKAGALILAEVERLDRTAEVGRKMK